MWLHYAVSLPSTLKQVFHRNIRCLVKMPGILLSDYMHISFCNFTCQSSLFCRLLRRIPAHPARSKTNFIFCDYTHTCNWNMQVCIRTLLWLAAKIGFDEVPKVGGIQKSSCLAGGIFFFLHLLIRAMLQLTWQKKKQFRQLNELCGYKNTDDVTRVKVYWKVWKCRM